MADELSSRGIPTQFSPKLKQCPTKPAWSPRNLSEHFAKRRRVDIGCLESMIQVEAGLQLAPGHYRKRSEQVFSYPALIARYQKEESLGSGSKGKFDPPRQQFTDGGLMTAITSDDRRTFITCYHWHFDPISCQGKPESQEEIGRQLQMVARRLRDKQKSKKIRALTFLDS
jgi:hypothetical protein